MHIKRYHHIFDIDFCHDKISDKEFVADFVEQLAGVVDMHIIKGPIVAEGMPENPGLSALAIIDFSHISIHTFQKTNEVLIDVFSCKAYDKEKVLAFCKEQFATSQSTVREKEVWWG